MTRAVQIVRLFTATTVMSAACFFVVQYDRLAAIRYPFDHPHADGHWIPPGGPLGNGRFVPESRPQAAEFVSAYCTYAYAVPIAGLLLGILFIWRWPQRPVLTELVVSAMWVLGLIWAGFVLLEWQIQNIPVFHGMYWHY
jgi:hypothetical protein